MDVVGFIEGLNFFDILAAFFVAGFFVLGYIQGALRRVLGLGITLVSLLVALNLRDPLGAWLAQYWAHLPRLYVYMLAFGGSFLTIFIAGSIAAQVFYRKTTLFTKATVVDELVGGILGALQALLLIGALILVLDSYFARFNSAPAPGELGLLRDIYNLYAPSHMVELFRASLIPLFIGLFGWFVPRDLREFYP